MKQDLLTFISAKPEYLFYLLELAQNIKQNPQNYSGALNGKSIVGLFEKPSLRTRLSFDIGINKLGGHFLYLDSQSNNLAGREAAKDMGANIGCWADAIVARVYSHETLETLAEASNVPVINALCDLYHPCQGLADFLTLKEVFDDLAKVKIAYIGDGNNVSHSLMIIGALLGAEVCIVTPEGYGPDSQIVDKAITLAGQYGGTISVSTDLADASGAQVLYTDTWISMGDKTSIEDIQSVFSPYQLNSALMTKTGAQFAMHCQPAHREQEISSELMDSDRSLLLQQAENRMWAQNAILIDLLTKQK